MNKYIDAGKLIAEIEALKRRKGFLPLEKFPEITEAYMARGVQFTCDDIVNLIRSLQQEQPKEMYFAPLNRLIKKIPSESWNDTVNNYARKLRDCLIREGYRKDAELLQGYISYMNGNNVPMTTMDEQEQPTVDLEKEIESFFPESYFETAIDFDDVVDIARHFYELGLNARKED